MSHSKENVEGLRRNSGNLSRRNLLKSAPLFGLAKSVFANERGVPFKMVGQSSAIRLPTERLNTEVGGLRGLLRVGSTVVIPENCFTDSVNPLRPSENWYGTHTDAKEFGLNLGAFCAANIKHEVLDRLAMGVTSAKCLLEFLKQVVEEDVAMEILGPLSGAMNLVLLFLIIQQYRNYRIDKEMYEAAVKLADKISSTATVDSGCYLFRSYYLSEDEQFLEEKVFFQGTYWEKGHPLWTARYQRSKENYA